ncbi:MAG: permease of the major facilitator superfamily [Myxococcaceae bacterium]|nr:permease of the major facilitator superfamily [Myxococcaceae bacterium]
MFERIGDRNILVIFGATLLLGAGYGVSIALTSLHLDARHFSKHDIGTLAAWFALGIVLLSLPMGALIRRFSARAVLVSSLVGYAACVSLFPHLHSYAAIAAARSLDGAFSVGVWVSSETILLSRARSEHKAYVTSLYAVAVAIGYVVGPLVARWIVTVAPTGSAFMASGVLSLSAAALVLAQLDADVPETHGHDTPADGPPVSAWTLLWRIKASCFGTFAYGYFQSSVVLFLPLYLVESKGIAREQTILIPAFFAGGMLLFSNVAGRVADRVGHLRVMRVLAVVGAATTASFILLDRFGFMAVAVFVAGATLASISPVSLALQGVVTEPWNYSRSNAIYNTFYAAGMLLGPPVSSVLFERVGGSGMLAHLAALWAAFALFGLVFAKDDPAAARG